MSEKSPSRFMYPSSDHLVILDADGTLFDTFPVVEEAFSLHGMDIGDRERFQRRRKLLKYLGGLREFPKNLRQQLDRTHRKQFKQTLTEIYRASARPFPGMIDLLRQLIEAPGVRVGIVSRNVTAEPETTLSIVLQRYGIDSDTLDFMRCIPRGDKKTEQFRLLRDQFGINPLRTVVCGDEAVDYEDASGAGLRALIAAYGFEDQRRLVEDDGVPAELVVPTPEMLALRLCHALGLAPPSR